MLADTERYSMDYGFVVGPGGEFAIENGVSQVALHRSVAGWIEALALEWSAAHCSPRIVTIHGEAVDDLDLTGFEPFDEVAGVSDTWWRRGDTVVAVRCGEALLFGHPASRSATLYEGIVEAPIYLDY
ncbi:hypothetical protein JIG36_50710 [Actinoplanes sp. LDG1-06]|uniref:Uncharacterized protein n=1 Tax=Paractinoplanes ovalisporus TaxID=2810368 RepID=A0ABS2AV92_9ACTN|nr:hypothetical protein [Actinoplanes ovalisporus]MBM2623790.1 hypothetical protein [Actinoplanes ovalisporus]